MSEYSLTIKLTKKDQILKSALELFANEGYDGVSTQEIADQANVSEGLIFKHFKSKRGLLTNLMEQAEAKIQEIFAQILHEQDPNKVIRDTIHLVFKVDKVEYDFWRLQYKLKWEKEYFNPEKMKPVEDKLCWAFAELCYPSPELEANLLIKIIDAVAIAILQDNLESQIKIQSFLLNKYKVDEQ